MNKHIEKYLNLYLEKQDLEYATLLTGEWGCGKTFFIKNYIDNIKESKDNKYQFVYVSLFGLKDISSVNEAIFQEIHPILSHRGMKFLGGVLKSAIKLGFQIDLIGNKDKETSIDIDINKFNLLDDVRYKNIVFIFDDLERTSIPFKEILGFINSLCENQKLKTIIISNENEIKDTDETYRKFKEKVIGKSFTIHNDNESYWRSFKDKYSSQLKKYEIIINIIRSTFERVGNRNYRNLTQITNDYIDFTKEIKNHYLDNDDFIKSLSEQFYTLSLEYKKHHDIDLVLNSLKQNNSAFYYNLTFDKDIWKMIITSSYNSYSEINELISLLPIFNIKDEESWQKLWHYRENSKDDFYHNLEDVKKKFNSIEYESIGVLMHAVSMLIFFMKKGLCKSISIKSIEETLSKYLSKYTNNSLLPDLKFFRLNSTGLGYINESDEDFTRIREEFHRKIIEKGSILEKNKIIDGFYNLLSSIKIGDWDNVYKDYDKYRYTPILNENTNKFIEKLTNDINDYNGLYNFCYFLDDRYKTNHTMNGRKLVEYLKSEEIFIDEFIVYLTDRYTSKELDPFEKLKLDEILYMLKLKKERFNVY